MAHFSAFPHPESRTNSCFHPAIFPIPSSCMLDNTALFPVALFSPKVFSFSWFELCFSTARLCSAIHEVERGRMREEKSCAGVEAQGDYSRQQELQRSWLKQPEHRGYAESWEGSQLERSASLQQGNRERADLQSMLDEVHRELYKPRKILLMLGQVSFHADVLLALALSLCWTSSVWLILHKFQIFSSPWILKCKE